MNRNPADLPPSKTPEERKNIIELASKSSSEYKNPCMREQKMSYKCLSDNNYDKTKCTDAFQNYINCREFWSKVESDRRRRGISPYLPWPEDRQQVKEEYLKKMGLVK